MDAKQVMEVDEQGLVVDIILLNDEQIEKERDKGRLLITKGWYDQDQRLFTPKWDFESKQWIEGLSPEEVAKREAEIEEQNNKLPTVDMNAVALMELTSKVYEGGE